MDFVRTADLGFDREPFVLIRNGSPGVSEIAGTLFHHVRFILRRGIPGGTVAGIIFRDSSSPSRSTKPNTSGRQAAWATGTHTNLREEPPRQTHA